MVTREPTATSKREIIEDLLSPLGLRILQVGENTWAVVESAPATGQIAGQVRQRNTRAPIVGAIVGLPGSERTAITDAAGRFVLPDIQPGRYFLNVKQPAFAVASTPGVSVNARETAPVDVYLDPVASVLQEVVVTASRYVLSSDTPAPQTFLTRQDIQSLPKLLDDPLRAVQRLPGVASGQLSALAHIRGGEENEVMLLLDGFQLSEPFHLKNFLSPVSVLNSRALGAMDVYSGGFQANYGDRMSGIIDATSTAPPTDHSYELGLSLFHASALGSGHFGDGRGEWLISGRRSNLDLIANVADSTVGRPAYYDAFGRVKFRFSDRTSVFGEFLTSGDDISANTSGRTETANASYRNLYFWGGIENTWTDSLQSRLILGFTDVDNDREGVVDDPGKRTGFVHDGRSFWIGTAKLDFQDARERLFTRWGLEGRVLKAKYRYSSSVTFADNFPLPGDPMTTITRTLMPQPDGYQYGAYLTARFRATDRLNIELGMRGDTQTYDDAGGRTEVSPRLNVMFNLTDDTRLRASWGRFFQPQSINQLQVEDGVDVFYPAQRADHTVASVEQVLPWHLNLRIEAYYKDYANLRPRFENFLDPQTLIPELEADRLRIAPNSGRARGVEFLLARHEQGPWSWWLNYSWSRASRIGSMARMCRGAGISVMR